MTELHDFITSDVARWYPEEMAHIKLTLLEAGHEILGNFDASLSGNFRKRMEARNIDVRTDTALLKIEERGNMAVAHLKPTTADGEGAVEELNFGCMVWSAGLQQVKFIEAIDSWEKGPGGRLLVDDYQRVPSTKGRVMAIGDCCANQSGALVPLAQVAEQQGKYLANVFNGSYADFHDPSGRLDEELPLPAPVRPYSWPVPEFMFDARPTFRFFNKGAMSSAGAGGG